MGGPRNAAAQGRCRKASGPAPRRAPQLSNFPGAPSLDCPPCGFQGVAQEVTSRRWRGDARPFRRPRQWGGCGARSPSISGFPLGPGPIRVACRGGAGPTTWRWEEGAAAGWWALVGGGFRGCQAGLLLGWKVPGLVAPYRGGAGRGQRWRAESLAAGRPRGRGLRWECGGRGIPNCPARGEKGGFKLLRLLVYTWHGRCRSPTHCLVPRFPFVRSSGAAGKSAGATSVAESLRTEI